MSRDGGNYGQTDVELIGSRFAIQRAREAIDEITSQAYWNSSACLIPAVSIRTQSKQFFVATFFSS